MSVLNVLLAGREEAHARRAERPARAAVVVRCCPFLVAASWHGRMHPDRLPVCAHTSRGTTRQQAMAMKAN